MVDGKCQFYTKDGVWTTQDGGSYEWPRQKDGGCRSRLGLSNFPEKLENNKLGPTGVLGRRGSDFASRRDLRSRTGHSDPRPPTLHRGPTA